MRVDGVTGCCLVRLVLYGQCRHVQIKVPLMEEMVVPVGKADVVPEPRLHQAPETNNCRTLTAAAGRVVLDSYDCTIWPRHTLAILHPGRLPFLFDKRDETRKGSD